MNTPNDLTANLTVSDYEEITFNQQATIDALLDALEEVINAEFLDDLVIAKLKAKAAIKEVHEKLDAVNS